MKGHDALLATFTEHAKEPLREVDAHEVEPTELGHAKSRAVEHLTDRGDERGPLVVAPVVLQEIVELFTEHDLGQLLRGARADQGVLNGLSTRDVGNVEPGPGGKRARGGVGTEGPAPRAPAKVIG